MRGRSGLVLRPFRWCALLLLAATVAYPHDIWLLPDHFTLSKGDTLIVRQLVGSELEVEAEVELLWRMTPRFELITPDGSIDLLSELRETGTRRVVKPVLERKVDFEGQALLTMEHAFIHNESSTEKFLEYLEHEDLDVEKFRKHLAGGREQRERYARTVKCLLQVGTVAGGDLHKRVLGQKIEIVLLQNPYQLDPGDDLEVQVLFDGEPLRDQLVTALNGDGEQLVSTSKARTNETGIARFRLEQGGFWLIRLVHLMPCSESSGGDCEYAHWESHWTSYSFEVD
jgi:uncharacterized GH25 family protein